MIDLEDNNSCLTSGLVYVVDSADRSRMAEAREELMGILESEEMRGVPVCILANKQDLPSKYLYGIMKIDFEETVFFSIV